MSELTPARNAIEIRTEKFSNRVEVYPFTNSCIKSVTVLYPKADGVPAVVICPLVNARSAGDARAWGLALLQAAMEVEYITPKQ